MIIIELSASTHDGTWRTVSEFYVDHGFSDGNQRFRAMTPGDRNMANNRINKKSEDRRISTQYIMSSMHNAGDVFV